ncbi:MAG: YifB family Mg chelatase-like AAA ATPase, partial [Ilumatobacter sp.]
VEAESVRRCAFFGELGLDGSIRPVPGAAPMVGVLGDHDVIVPIGNATEAEVIASGRVHPVCHLRELIDVLANGAPWPDHERPEASERARPERPPGDLSDVVGQPMARHALEIAAAGGHHLLMVGPPGAGKTMLAARLPGLLPELDPEAALQATMIHSAAGVELPPHGLVRRPPFRAPHHTCSEVAMVGGGSHSLRPGEASLAHRGVLFLDELPEFAARALDTLRQPLEEGSVRVSRAAIHTTIPAGFQLVAAMNPCPCGGGNAPGECECGEARVRKYVSRVSGPLLDRFDLRVGVEPPSIAELLDGGRGEATRVVAARVARARARAVERQGVLNAALAADELDTIAPLGAEALGVLRHELERGRLSARGFHRVRRVARTIADLHDDANEVIDESEVALALEMRTTVRRSGSFAGRAA